MSEERQHLRILEAVLFASESPLTEKQLAEFVPEDAPVEQLLQSLVETYASRGVNLVQRGGRWHFQTAADLADVLRRDREQQRRLSRAAVETLAIIAYHEPVTRAQIEEIRGVAISKGTLDVLMEAGWVRPAGRREVPGRPILYATTAGFLAHFGLASRRDLPGLGELRAAGLLEPIEAAMSQLPFAQEPGGGEDHEGD